MSKLLIVSIATTLCIVEGIKIQNKLKNLQGDLVDDKTLHDYGKFLSHHHRNFRNLASFVQHANQYEKNLQKIEEHNKYHAEESGYVMVENDLTDLTL